MTSISVGGSSYLEGGLSVGDTSACALKGQDVGSLTPLAATKCNKPALVLQGSLTETIVHTAPIRVNETYARLYGRPHPSDAWSTTKIGFQIQPASQAEVQFPATSGTVITTGNLEDITRFEGKLLNVSGPSHLRGPVTLGANRSTPIQFSGFVEGDIVSRTAPRFPDRGANVENVPDPFTWGYRRFAFCSNGYIEDVNDDRADARQARFPGWERFNGSWAAVSYQWEQYFSQTGTFVPVKQATPVVSDQ